MGLHRLEAAKALGEQTIVAFFVDARIRLAYERLSGAAIAKAG
jgi:hypothetical protein